MIESIEIITSPIALILRVIYDIFLEEPLKHAWDYYRLKKRLEKDIKELCQEYDLNNLKSVFETLIIDKDLLDKKATKINKKIKKVKSFVLWKDQVDHLINFFNIIFELAETEINQRKEELPQNYFKFKKALMNTIKQRFYGLEKEKIVIESFIKIEQIIGEIEKIINGIDMLSNQNQKRFRVQKQSLDDLNKSLTTLKKQLSESGDLTEFRSQLEEGFDELKLLISKTNLHKFGQLKEEFHSTKRTILQEIQIQSKSLEKFIVENIENLSHDFKEEIREELESNYDDIMMIQIKEPKYFRMLETASLGGVAHVDIGKERVVRIPKLIKDLKSIMFSENAWIILSGNSGSSKTTTAKIIAHDAKKKGISVMLCNMVEQIAEFAEKVRYSNKKWLLIIDDLHRTQYGQIQEKLIVLNSMIHTQKKKIYVLTTSRLTLLQIKQACKDGQISRQDKQKSLRVAEYFKEINVEDYQDQIRKAKATLIKAILKKLEFSPNELKKTEQHLLENYTSNFVLLGFAMLPLLKKITKVITPQVVYKGIIDYLRDEFDNILKTTDSIPPRILLQAFIGICYESVFDENVSVYDFHYDDDENTKKLLISTFKALRNQGLVLEFENWIQNRSKFTYSYSIHHAQIATFYIKTLQSNLDYFNIDGKTFNWKELCTLKRFRTEIKAQFKLSDILESFIRLESLVFRKNCIEKVPESIGNLTSLKELYLYGNDLKTLPKSIGNISSLEVLSLWDNNLSTLPESIGNLTSLKELDLRLNKISTFPESITKLTSLETLRLYSNDLSTLPESIGNLTSLQVLGLGCNNLSTLPESITKLTSLKELDLRWNNFTTLPESITNLKSLISLSLIGNILKTLPESIANLKSLTYLSLGDNDITTFPESITKLTSLKTLRLYSNDLSTLPESITKLTSLEKLWSSNGLSTLPEVIKSLESLESKFIGGKLTTLPESITNLTSLQVLKLGGNNFTTFPESITKLTSLKELDLRWNKITTLPESIGKLKLIKELDLEFNKLRTLPESITKFTLLERLDLGNNIFSNLPESIGSLPSLEILELSRNNLTTLPESITNLKSLTSLSLIGNILKTLPESIGNLTSLKELYLYGNDLKTLPESILKLSNLAILDVKDNPLEIEILGSTQTEELLKKLEKHGVDVKKNKFLNDPPANRDG